MAATRDDVKRWVEVAKKSGATHVISVCDTFDYNDYPVYVMPNQSVDTIKKKYDGVNMQKINEVIEIEQDKKEPKKKPRGKRLY